MLAGALPSALEDVGSTTIGNVASADARAEHLRPEVELVVAGHHHVDAHVVEDVDDVDALVDAGEERGRERVAGMDEEGRAPWRARALTTAASRAKPPRPSSSSMRSMSLVWTKVSVTVSASAGRGERDRGRCRATRLEETVHRA